MKIINNTSKKSLPDLFAIASYQASQKGELRCLTLAELSLVDENEVNHAVIFVEVKSTLGITTWIFKYLNGEYFWADTIVGSFNSWGDIDVSIS